MFVRGCLTIQQSKEYNTLKINLFLIFWERKQSHFMLPSVLWEWGTDACPKAHP